MRGPKPLPKWFLHIVWTRASSFNWQYPLLSLRSSSSFLRLLRFLVTSICPFIFPSITCCRRQFLRKMWSNQLAFRFLISCRTFLCLLTLSNTYIPPKSGTQLAGKSLKTSRIPQHKCTNWKQIQFLVSSCSREEQLLASSCPSVSPSVVYVCTCISAQLPLDIFAWNFILGTFM